MAQIVAFITNTGLPLTAPTDEPTIRVRRIDTGALVETDQDMTELGDGLWSFGLTTTDGLEYAYRIDADPASTAQVTAAERYLSGAVSGTTDARIETDVPAVLVDTGTTIPAALAVIDATADAILVDTGTSLPSLIATIDTNVNAILVDTGTTIPASLATIPANVWTVDIRADTGITFDTAAKALNSCRIIQYNKLAPATSGDPSTMRLYEDDGTTTKADFDVLDFNGAAVTGSEGAPAYRAAGT